VVTPAGRRAITLGSAAVAPDRGRARSDATLVEASVTARLLGLRILTLDARVALVPAGHRLVDAVRNLDEESRLLAEVHRDGA
jgi:hypothetical protein